MTLEQKLLEWVAGDADAAHFLELVWSAAQIWDDANDEGDLKDANALLSWMAFGKEYDKFFVANSAILRPAMLQMYLSWTAANALEKGEEEDIEKAYMLRAGFYQLVHTVVWLVRGHNVAVSLGPEIFRMYGETLDDLKQEMKGRYDA